MERSEKTLERRIEALALTLYDQLNPDPDKVIRVSKDECIRRARQQLSK